MTVEDKPKPGRAKPAAERFEIMESDPTAHLTESQKGWNRARLRPATERFAVLTPQPTLTLRFHLAGTVPDADPVALAADICGLIQALSDAERDLGGGGLALADQWSEPGMVILTLRHVIAAGAADRVARLAEMLNNEVARATIEPSAGALQLLGEAATSSERRVRLLLAGSRRVSRCEVLTPAA